MSFKEFINLLRKEYEYYLLLKEKADLKKQAIIDNDIDRLAAVVEIEQEIIGAIDELEEERNKYLAEIAEENGVEDDIVSFRFLADLLSKEDKDILHDLRLDFLDVLTELQELNELNRKLIEDSVQINNFSLQLIRQAAGEGVTYNKPGKKKDESSHIIDRKA